jgi:hypothetical protein
MTNKPITIEQGYHKCTSISRIHTTRLPLQMTSNRCAIGGSHVHSLPQVQLPERKGCNRSHGVAGGRERPSPSTCLQYEWGHCSSGLCSAQYSNLTGCSKLSIARRSVYAICCPADPSVFSCVCVCVCVPGVFSGPRFQTCQDRLPRLPVISLHSSHTCQRKLLKLM